MARMKWLADVEANAQVVVEDGQDPVTVQLYKGLVFEASENDPFIARAIAREYAKVMPEHKKPAPPPEDENDQDDPPQEEDDI